MVFYCQKLIFYYLEFNTHLGAHLPPGEVPEGAVGVVWVKNLRVFWLWGPYSVVPRVDVASEVDQPDVVALVGHEKAQAVVCEDDLGRGGLVAMEV